MKKNKVAGRFEMPSQIIEHLAKPLEDHKTKRVKSLLKKLLPPLNQI